MAEINQNAALGDHASLGTTTVEGLSASQKLALARLINMRLVGLEMRAAQIKYFKTRSRQDLIAARQLEKQFDQLVK